MEKAHRGKPDYAQRNGGLTEGKRLFIRSRLALNVYTPPLFTSFLVWQSINAHCRLLACMNKYGLRIFYRYGIPSEYPFTEMLAYGILAGYMASAPKARVIRDEFEAAIGILPKYPWSRQALKDLRETLHRYNAAKANLKANDAWRQGPKTWARSYPTTSTLTHQRALVGLNRKQASS